MTTIEISPRPGPNVPYVDQEQGTHPRQRNFAKLSPNSSFSWAEFSFHFNFPHPQESTWRPKILYEFIITKLKTVQTHED